MLEYAYLNKDSLLSKWTMCLQNSLFSFYFMNRFINYTLEIYESDYSMIQYISKTNDGNILGYFGAHVNQEHNYIENLNIINFTEKPNIVFSKDTKSFFDILFVYKGFRKVVFHALAKNPACDIYKKMIEKYNIGKTVGVLKDSKLLCDGKFYDEVIFEIYKENYIFATTHKSVLIKYRKTI